MSLPGKLCIGILEEDNPLKFYYRFKPLIVREGDAFTVFDSTDVYPEDGCIRIVPDKNESGRFKLRMRQTGLFGLIDLTAHNGENDKIRPNKNYRGDGIEHNAYIIYSDVVRELPPLSLFQIVTVADEETLASLKLSGSHAAQILVEMNGAFKPNWYSCENGSEDYADPTPLLETTEAVDSASLIVFECNGFNGETLRFAVDPTKIGVPATANVPVQVPAPMPAPEPVAPVAETPAPVVPQPAVEAKPAVAEKSWISHNPGMVQAAPDPHLSPAQQNLALQCGLNPRRGRSLQELLDEKWARSRLDQLGQSTAVATGAPVSSPVDQAVEAVRAAWENPNTQKPLLEALGKIEDFGVELNEFRKILTQNAVNDEITELEAQRIAIQQDIAHLAEKREDMRKQLMVLIRREDEAEFADMKRKIDAEKAELDRLQKQADGAKKAAQTAQDTLDALSNGKLEKTLREFALNSHIMDLLDRMHEPEEIEAPAAPLPEIETICFADFVARVEAVVTAKGWQLPHEQVVNLCACVSISPALILSGAVGSGKTATAALIAEALGWTISDDIEPDAELPSLIFVDDCNIYEDSDPLSMVKADSATSRSCIAVRDNAFPLSDNTLNKGFTVRLELPEIDTDWNYGASDAKTEFTPASLEKIQCEAFAVGTVSEAQTKRMNSFREWAAGFGVRISRNALNESYRYCSLTGGLLNEKEAIDLAIAQRILPTLIASAPMPLLAALKAQIEDLPHCVAFMNAPVPIKF